MKAIEFFRLMGALQFHLQYETGVLIHSVFNPNDKVITYTGEAEKLYYYYLPADDLIAMRDGSLLELAMKIITEWKTL
jgi:hypothetical protein